MMNESIQPYGGKLVNLICNDEDAAELHRQSGDYASVTLSKRQLCDLEMLLTGGFSPLEGFMDSATYASVLDGQRLPDGTLWPIPICLPVGASLAGKLNSGDRLALRDQEGFMLAVMTVSDVWKIDTQREAMAVYGSDDGAHPGVNALVHQDGDHYVGGIIQGVQDPMHHDFEELWNTPEELRNLFHKMGWNKVIAFHTSKPMHRLHVELCLNVAKDIGGHLLIHPVAGMTKPGDLEYFARVRCYQAISKYFPHRLSTLSLLPLAMRIAGPKEALWHAIVQQNYGCTHFIVGPDQASPERNNGGKAFYQTAEAQQYVNRFKSELAIEPVLVPELAYSESEHRFFRVDDFPSREKAKTLDEFAIKGLLSKGEKIPAWSSYPEVIGELRKIYRPRNKVGFTLFFTGLSGSGKSTLAKIIYAKLIEDGRRPVTLLDGDIVRLNLSSELGFSKRDRDININRIGFVANEISKNGGVAICAPIAPYASTRRKVRQLIEENGSFIEIYISTPIEVCEQRDRKGLYAKARKGIIPEFTGVSDPYDEPENPEIRINTSLNSPMEASQQIYLYLLQEGYLDPESDRP